jgi:ABC-type branched-subunit amino acid transport system substrate-binding protein
MLIMLKGKARVLIFCLLALLLVGLPPLAAACGGDDDGDDGVDGVEEREITIGSSHVLTGAPASSAHVTFTGAMEVINYINEVEGGIDGIKINYVWADDKYDPAEAAIAYKTMRDRNHPIMYISMSVGYIVSGVLDMLERDKTPALFYFAFQPDLWKEAPMLFSFGFQPANSMTGLVRWILQDWEASGKTGRPKLGYMHWDMTHGTAPLDIGIADWAEEHGVDFVSRSYRPMPLDLRPTILAMEDDGVDYLFLQGVVGDASVFIRDARAAGLWDDGDMKFIIDPTVDAHTALLPIVGEDAEGVYQLANNEPWTSGPSDALRKQADIREYAGHTPTWVNIGANSAWMEVLKATLRQAVADVGYENLNGEAMYNALLKLGPMDTNLTGFKLTGWGPDKKIAQSGIIMTQYQRWTPESGIPTPPDEVGIVQVAISDWVETANLFEGE